MEQTFIYFQPEYINKFQCDGQSCKGHCCKYWSISIDNETYKKYSSIKPKHKAKEITQKINFNEEKNQHFIKLDEKGICPFLTEDNWCILQKTYGADFLSNTCMTYPRKTFRIGDFYERSLSLTCPVAADLILNQTESLSFEQAEVSLNDYFASCRDMVRIPNISKDLIKNVFNVQYAAISILQERRFTIDQRLIILGYFFDQLEDLINENKFAEIETLSMIYTSEDFLKNQAPQLIKSINFNAEEHIKNLMEIFVLLYGDNKYTKATAETYLEYVAKALEIKVNPDGTASIDEIVKSYNKNKSIREKLFTEHAYIFENYLVQEFFYCLYPWAFEYSITFNYTIFLITYKILELMIFSMAVVKPSTDSKEIIKFMRWFVHKLDHGKDYINSISEGLNKNQNIVNIMRALLQR